MTISVKKTRIPWKMKKTTKIYALPTNKIETVKFISMPKSK